MLVRASSTLPLACVAVVVSISMLLFSGLACAADVNKSKDITGEKLPSKAADKVAPAREENKNQVAAGGKALDLPDAPRPASVQDLKVMRALDSSYQKAPSVKMDVDKTLKLGLLGGPPRKSKGQLTLATGCMRLELAGEEKSMLIVNQKKFWAVTYPSVELKEAPIQVVTGSIDNKKGHSQSILGVLTRGGFLKFFDVFAVQKENSGETTYFMQPQKAASEFKRAQLKVSRSGKEIVELHYWDVQDNETLLAFTAITFGKKLSAKTFEFDPPANAEVTNM